MNQTLTLSSAKKDKYPYGYPGDVLGAKSTPYYNCTKCDKTFSGTTGDAADKKACDACGTDCNRLKPQKVEPEPDPVALASVQEKLKELKL